MWTCLGFLAAQVYSMPFRFDEDNALKAMAEVHLFLMLMVCLVLKNDLEGEFLRENGYDVLLTVTFALCVPLVGVLGVLRKMFHSSRIVLKAAVQTMEGRRNEADLLFDKLDMDSDGVLTLTELKRGIGKIRSVTGMEMKARQILVNP